jgi:hypothetical protein
VLVCPRLSTQGLIICGGVGHSLCNLASAALLLRRVLLWIIAYFEMGPGVSIRAKIVEKNG